MKLFQCQEVDFGGTRGTTDMLLECELVRELLARTFYHLNEKKISQVGSTCICISPKTCLFKFCRNAGACVKTVKIYRQKITPQAIKRTTYQRNKIDGHS